MNPSLRKIVFLISRCYLAEKWSPFEISVFEASITLYGKNFNRVQKNVRIIPIKPRLLAINSMHGAMLNFVSM